MEQITAVEAVAYGFKHILTSVAIVVAGFLFTLFGLFMIIEELPLIGAFVALFGIVILSAGSAGLGYKVIADAVAAGINRADLSEQLSRKTGSKMATKIEDNSE